MKTTRKTTGELQIGNIVWDHGAKLEITSIKIESIDFEGCKGIKYGDGSYYRQRDIESAAVNGPVVYCKTKLLNDGGSIPKSWLYMGDKESAWTIQGNNLALWTVEISE